MTRSWAGCDAGKSLWAVLVFLSPAPAIAQDRPPPSADATPDPDQNAIGDIIVTAQRKNERLQDVPIAVNVETADTVREKGLTGLTPATFGQIVPAFTGAVVQGRGSYFLRGIGNTAGLPSSEPSVATYVDGVYIASNSANLFQFNNIDRIEVLKGPQGTLFGRNATAGVIQIITKNPSLDETSFDGAIGYGNYQTFEMSAYGSTPLSSNLAVNVALQTRRRERGFGRDLLLGEETNKMSETSVRAKLLFEPSSKFQIILAGDYARSFNSAERPHPQGVPQINGVLDPPTNGFDNYLNVIPSYTTRQAGVSLHLSYDLGFARLIGISAYRDVDPLKIADFDGGSLDYVEARIPEPQHNLSQELQLVSSANSKIDWLFGLFYYDSTAGWGSGQRVTGQILGPAQFQFSLASQRARSLAGYGQATASILPATKLTLGLRYTRDREDFFTQSSTAFGTGAAYTANQSSGKLTWRVALDQAFTSDIHGYVSYNRGTKSGGYSLGVSRPGYAPEVLDAYEAGVKSVLFDKRVRFNAALFYYDYKNIQLQQNQGATTPIVNAAAARLKGIDVDFEINPVRNLTFSGGFVVLDDKFTNYPNAVSYGPSGGAAIIFDAKGHRLQFASPFQGNIGVRYKLPTRVGELSLSSNIAYNDGYYFNASNRLRQNSYTLVNASLNWTSLSKKYNAEFWIRNIGSTNYYSVASESAQGDIVTRADPQTYGVTLSIHI